ncbi:MAG: 2Fe-2S iron-sulfur cluster-binding protein [Thermoguttaceae bacterium]
MSTIIIDGREIELPSGERLNCIQAAKLAGVKIPHYCWHPALSVVGSCRMCLVEIGARDAKTGNIKMEPKLVPACNAIAADGMVVVTNSEKVARARAMVEEGLLLRHPIDCPICDKAGECKLQDYHFRHGQKERRADLLPFTSRRRDIGDITLFVDRCILCSRCVRFTAQISGAKELMITGRGAHEEIDIVPGFPLNNKLSGNVVDLCPVGALGDKDFLYKQRVWFLRRHKGVCTGCATGCSIWIEENQDRIYRLKPRKNPRVNQWWICNDGRYAYPHVHSERRLTRARRRDGNGFVELDWSGFVTEIRRRFGEVGHCGAILSPFLTVEEAYLLCKFMRSVDKNAELILGPIPASGEDEHFPNGFSILAEKCPNRRGVEAVLAHFTGGKIMTFDAWLESSGENALEALWFSGGYKEPWIDQSTARRFAQMKLLVVQDLFASPLAELAAYQLPGGAFAERAGSYVNRYDRLQQVPRAIRPPQGVRTEGGLYWELLSNKGLYNSRTVLDEVAREILYFHVAKGPIPEVGVDLKANLIA